MDDAIYAANVFAERACPLCGTDRWAARRPRAPTCAACGAPLMASEAFVQVSQPGAATACSIRCLTGLVAAGPAERAACPLCRSRWVGGYLPARSCGTCAATLRASAGYVAMARGGRLRTFCRVGCLEKQLRLPNPFCG